MDDNVKLLPCPFCGIEPTYVGDPSEASTIRPSARIPNRRDCSKG